MDCVLFLFGVSDIWKNFCEKSEKMSARKYREKMSRKNVTICTCQDCAYMLEYLSMTHKCTREKDNKDRCASCKDRLRTKGRETVYGYKRIGWLFCCSKKSDTGGAAPGGGGEASGGIRQGSIRTGGGRCGGYQPQLLL